MNRIEISRPILIFRKSGFKSHNKLIRRYKMRAEKIMLLRIMNMDGYIKRFKLKKYLDKIYG